MSVSVSLSVTRSPCQNLAYLRCDGSFLTLLPSSAKDARLTSQSLQHLRQDAQKVEAKLKESFAAPPARATPAKASGQQQGRSKQWEAVGAGGKKKQGRGANASSASSADCQFGQRCINYWCSKRHPAGRKELCKCSRISCSKIHNKKKKKAVNNNASGGQASHSHHGHHSHAHHSGKPPALAPLQSRKKEKNMSGPGRVPGQRNSNSKNKPNRRSPKSNGPASAAARAHRATEPEMVEMDPSLALAMKLAEEDQREVHVCRNNIAYLT